MFSMYNKNHLVIHVVERWLFMISDFREHYQAPSSTIKYYQPNTKESDSFVTKGMVRANIIINAYL